MLYLLGALGATGLQSDAWVVFVLMLDAPLFIKSFTNFPPPTTGAAVAIVESPPPPPPLV